MDNIYNQISLCLYTGDKILTVKIKFCAHDHVHVLCIATFVFLDLVGHLDLL